MKNIDNNNLAKEQLDEVLNPFNTALWKTATAYPRLIYRSLGSRWPKNTKPLKDKADQLKNGYKNEAGEWIPGYKDRHPILKLLPYPSAYLGYKGAEYGVDKVIDVFTNTEFGPTVDENNSTFNGDSNVIVESGKILETLYNHEKMVARLNEEEVQVILNEVWTALAAKAAKLATGVVGKGAKTIGDKMIKRGEILKPGKSTITPKVADSKIEKQKKAAEVWNRQFKDETIPDADGLPIKNPKFLKGYTDFDLQNMLSINKDALIKQGLTPFIAGGQFYIAVETVPPALEVGARELGLTGAYNLGVLKWNDVSRYLKTRGDRESFGMPGVNESVTDDNNIVLDKFSNVICEADMIQADTMRNYIDIINGNSLNEGVLSWIANKVAAKPKKFSADDFDELLKDTDVTVIVKTRDRLAKSIQNAGADPALSNEVKTLDNIISQRINNSHK